MKKRKNFLLLFAYVHQIFMHVCLPDYTWLPAWHLYVKGSLRVCHEGGAFNTYQALHACFSQFLYVHLAYQYVHTKHTWCVPLLHQTQFRAHGRSGSCKQRLVDLHDMRFHMYTQLFYISCFVPCVLLCLHTMLLSCAFRLRVTQRYSGLGSIRFMMVFLHAKPDLLCKSCCKQQELGQVSCTCVAGVWLKPLIAVTGSVAAGMYYLCHTTHIVRLSLALV